jgi:hypothetical protein
MKLFSVYSPMTITDNTDNDNDKEGWVAKSEGWVAKLEGWVAKLEGWVAKLEGWVAK